MQAGPPPVEARVVQVSPSRESAMYVTATLMFRNTTDRPVSVAYYEFSWVGGRFSGPGQPLRLEPHQERAWNVRVTHASGDIDALLAGGRAARVDRLEVK